MFEASELAIDVAALASAVQLLDLTPGPGGSGMTDPAATQNVLSPLLDELLAGCPVLQVRVVSLYPSCQIVSHCDPALAGVRHHLPLVTNPGCWSFHGGTWQHLKIGQVYRMNPTIEHGAVNWGSTVRLHLMYDLETL